ncbi:MAG: DUF1998 domain-containing protein, partial [Gemmatimonadetes bacterium]|nr:DUF1998 domain-containing protein [Gemmatimonadota bacterium]
ALTAREHTAQVDADEREKREDAFKNASLPILFCSPTMELGVDIAGLQAVHMRNVPPTPANYAQRAGRAGRSGQPALVLVYCSDGSPHDSYYFRQPELMVRGSVQPPRVDLVNEDLLRAHVHAILIGELGLELGNSVADILDLTDTTSFPLKPHIADSFDNGTARSQALSEAVRVLARLPLDAGHAPWFVDGWIKSQVDGARTQLDRACDRWRGLYRAAEQQRERQHAILSDALTTPERRHEAERLYKEATIQHSLLLSQDVSRRQSDFYSYRYVAAEGFLPGYNFPRLPLSAFLPGRGRRDDSNAFLSRARFLAISEFGPRSIIYHEGSRYRIERVMFASQDADRNLSEGKLCATCGYGHIGGEDSKADVCESCGSLLTGKGQVYFPKLLRLTNVGARSVDRITSDEEERLRLGYEVRSAFRIDPTAPRRDATFTITGTGGDGTEAPVIAYVTYVPNALLWRINLGWAARKDPSQVGFAIDMNTGTWRKALEHEDAGADSESVDDPTVTNRARVETVVPFVDDHRNTLVLKLPTVDPSDGDALTTVMYALKRGIEAHYQIEDRELAAETLPSRTERTSILFFEAVEGGAGILAQLVDDPSALSRVARSALEILHFEPGTGRDLAAEVDRREPCQRACHECLLSYANQREHAILNRHLARDVLRDLVATIGHVTVAGRGRDEQFAYLHALCDTSLERGFLTFLRDAGHRLPTDAQRRIENARPDFVYGGTLNAAVFVDGPIHAYPDVGTRDGTIRAWLADRGVTVIAVGHDPSGWPDAVAAFRWVFG